jgi:hypothetical protein
LRIALPLPNKKAEYPIIQEYSAFQYICDTKKIARIPALAFPDFEHLGAANRAGSLGGWLAVFHFDGCRILHFPLGAAFHTIRLHPLSFPFRSFEAG